MNFLNFLTSCNSFLNLRLQTPAPSSFNFSDRPLESYNKSNNDQQSNGRQFNELLNSNPEALQKIVNVQIFTKQQQLVNQYMQLNLKKLEEKVDSIQKKDYINLKMEQQLNPQNHKKKIKKINKCGHIEKQHYAKGMCNNCYHKYGRMKKPWNCSHEKLYANGMCQNCYINKYNRKKREGKDHELKLEE